MNNSQFELMCSTWTKTFVVHSVTGTMSRLLKEAEGLNTFWLNNPEATYSIWKGKDEVAVFYSYTDLLQYLRKEVA